MTSLQTRLLEADMLNLTDSEAADALNAKSAEFPIRVDIQTAEIANILARFGKLRALRDLRASSTSAIAELGESIEMMLQGRWETIKVSDPAVDAAFHAQMSAVISLGILTQEQADEIDAFGDAEQSWSEVNGYGYISHIQIAKARGRG